VLFGFFFGALLGFDELGVGVGVGVGNDVGHPENPIMRKIHVTKRTSQIDLII
jgi:hypothetical protein